MTLNIRRVVTGHDKNGKAIVISDEQPKRTRTLPAIDQALLWVTDRTPATNAGDADAGDVDIGIPPPAKGSIFRVIDFHARDRRPCGSGPYAGGRRPAGRCPPSWHAPHQQRRLRHRHGRRDRHAARRFRSACEYGRCSDPTRHLSCVGQSRNQAVQDILHPDRCRSGRVTMVRACRVNRVKKRPSWPDLFGPSTDLSASVRNEKRSVDARNKYGHDGANLISHHEQFKHAIRVGRR